MLALNRITFICLCVAHFGSLLGNHAHGLVVPGGSLRSSTRSSTELDAFSSSRRREVFGNLKKAVFAGGLMGAFRREPALADDSPSPVTGRVVEFVIGNVGGEPGVTGTVKIQLVSGVGMYVIPCTLGRWILRTLTGSLTFTFPALFGFVK